MVGMIQDKLLKDVQAQKEFYLKVRKEYDRITIYENVMSTAQNEQKKDYKALRQNLELLAEKFFVSAFQ